MISQSNWHHKRKITEKYQSARITLRLARKQQNKKQKKNEPVQYKSGIGIGENLQINQNKKRRRTKEELQNIKHFKCEVINCNKSYIQISGLKNHVKTKHT